MSASSRCLSCNFPQPSKHNCSCHDEILNTLRCVVTFDEWDNIVEKLRVALYYAPIRKSYMFLRDTKSEHDTDGKLRKDKNSRNCFLEISEEELWRVQSADIRLDSFRRRVEQSLLCGHGSLAYWRRGGYRDVAAWIVGRLAIEAQLVNVLAESEVYRSGRIAVRMSQGFIDYHCMSTASCLLLGSQEGLLAYQTEYTRGELVDAAHALLVVPLHWLFIKDQKQTIGLLREAAQDVLPEARRGPDEKFTVTSFFKQVLQKSVYSWSKLSHADKALCPLDEFLRDGSSVFVIVSVVCYPDAIEFTTPGGKRNLTETPWECCVRETREETGLRLPEDPTHGSRGTGSEWLVATHLVVESVSLYVALHTSCSRESSSLANSVSSVMSTSTTGIVPSRTLTTAFKTMTTAGERRSPCWYFFSIGECNRSSCKFTHDCERPSEDWLISNDPSRLKREMTEGVWGRAQSMNTLQATTSSAPSNYAHTRSPCWHFFGAGACNRSPCRFSHDCGRPSEEWLLSPSPKTATQLRW